jgi:hypothetical protein
VERIRELETTLAVAIEMLVTAKVLGSLILYILIMEAVYSCEMSALTRATRRHIPQNSILHSQRRENFKSYTIAML